MKHDLTKFFGDDFFTSFFSFDKPYNYDNLGGRIYKYSQKDEDNEQLVVNVAGFSKDDIKLEPKTEDNIDYLYIVCTPSEEMKQYAKPINIRFILKHGFRLIEEIKADVVNGMLIVDVRKKENKPDIKIRF